MQAIGIIVSRVEQELKESIRGLGTAYEVWETLKALSENQSSLLTSRVSLEWEGIFVRTGLRRRFEIRSNPYTRYMDSLALDTGSNGSKCIF